MGASRNVACFVKLVWCCLNLSKERIHFFFQGQQNPAKKASEHIDLDIRKNNHSVNLTTVNATWSIEAWGKERPAFFR